MNKTYMYIAAALAVVIVAGFAYLFISDASLALPKTASEPTVSEDSVNAPNETGASPNSLSQAGTRIVENGVSITLIYLTSNGFVPNEVTIGAGEEVRFVNTTNGSMRIGTKDTLSSPFYTSFSQPNAVGAGETFQIGLTRQGLWTYENLNIQDGASGVVYIN